MNMKVLLLAFLSSPVVSVFAAATEQTPDAMLPESSIVLPWIVGIGIFVAAVIVGFKNSGRTHLD
jgi:hypothetical protein